MKIRLLLTLLCLSFTIFTLPALAQDGDGDSFPDNVDMCPTVPGTANGCPSIGGLTPTNNIFYLDNGLIKQWNPVTRQEVDWGATYPFNGKPLLSPNGRAIAYNSWASDADDMREAFLNNTYAGQFFGPLISNIWYYDLNEAARIASQPAGAFMTASDALGTVRSEPVWSPTGTSLAWTQLHLPSYQYELILYDLARGRQSSLPVDPGFWDVAFAMHTPRWGSKGVSIVTVQMGSGTPQYVLNVHEPFVSDRQYYLPFEPVFDHLWITDDTRVAFLQDTGWQIFQEQTEQVQPSTHLVRYSLNNPNGIRLHAYPSSTLMNWQAVAPNGTVLETFTTDLIALDDVAISPDGTGYAYINNGNLYVHQNGQTQFVGTARGLTTISGVRLSGGLTWGPMGWLVP